MINAINRVSKTCLWLIVFFGVIFTGFFIVNESAEAGSWSAFVEKVRQDVMDNERDCQ